MAKFNAKAVAHIKELAAKSQYMKREWKTDESSVMTLSEYAELIDPTYKHVEGNPIIIAKERKDGNIFLKMWISFGGEAGAEYDLSYDSKFDEGDEIDKNSLRFCIERFMDKEHLYITGTAI